MVVRVSNPDCDLVQGSCRGLAMLQDDALKLSSLGFNKLLLRRNEMSTAFPGIEHLIEREYLERDKNQAMRGSGSLS